MKNKYLSKITFAIFALVSHKTFLQAQDNLPTSKTANSCSYAYENNHYLKNSTPSDKKFYYPAHPEQTYDKGKPNKDYYNTSFMAGNYTSGVSSYSGSSTGPGISNGYSSTPRGTYKTDSRYDDRRVKPNPDPYYQTKR
jgi:hypothetical protein